MLQEPQTGVRGDSKPTLEFSHHLFLNVILISFNILSPLFHHYTATLSVGAGLV